MRPLFLIAWLNLARDRVALALTFALPIAFFTIFALIFGGMGSAGPSESRPLDILVVDLDGTEVSRRLASALERQEGLRTSTELSGEDGEPVELTRDSAGRAVRSGAFHAAVIIPPGFAEGFADFGGAPAPVEIIYDPANPVAEFAVAGMLQAAAFTAAPDVLFERGIESLEDFGGVLTPAQRVAAEDLKRALSTPSDAASPEAEGKGGGGVFTGLVGVDTTNVRELDPPDARGDPPENSMIAYYAAGMAVMFLLFSMSGAAGSILEEEESGALERLLVSSTSLTRIMAAKWLFYAGLGLAQVSVMFVYGSVAFGLPLWTPNHLAGFLAMSVTTALAAAAFGLLLASLCRSRGQLGGVSTIVILVMSAVGGSMVPRFIMPPAMEALGRFTFNGWAMDGYLAVFWNDDPQAGVLESLAPLAAPMAVLATMTVVFLAVARLAARRWETI